MRSTCLRKTGSVTEAFFLCVIHLMFDTVPFTDFRGIARLRSIVVAVAVFSGICHAAELPSEALGKLGDDEFKVREAAQMEVLKWARENQAKSPGMLFQYHRKAVDPEVKFRCMEILKMMAKDGYAKHGKGLIGIQMRDEMVIIPGKDGQQAAIRITFVLPGLAAEKTGLKIGDLLVGINGKGWPSPATDAMREQVMDMKPTTKITLQVLRNEKVEDVEVTLVKRPLTADNPMLERLPGRAAEAEEQQWQQYFQEWKQRHDPGV